MPWTLLRSLDYDDDLEFDVRREGGREGGKKGGKKGRRRWLEDLFQKEEKKYKQARK